MKKISYAVIGSGNHSLKVFIPAIKESYNSELISSSKDILSDGSVDAVYIATPNSFHAELVCKALGAGKHVLCEKPLSYLDKDLELVRQLLLPHLQLCTGFMYRLHPQYNMLRVLLVGEEILEVNAIFSYQIDLSNYNIRTDPEKGGGALLDVGCYLLDVVRFILEPEEINYSINKVSFCGTRDTEVQIFGEAISCPGRVKINLLASQQSERKQQLEIKTKNKVIILNSPFLVPRNKKPSITIDNIKGKKETIYVPPFNQVLAQINLVSESIQNGHLFSPLTNGIQNATDLSCLYSNIHSGRQIDSDLIAG